MEHSSMGRSPVERSSKGDRLIPDERDQISRPICQRPERPDFSSGDHVTWKDCHDSLLQRIEELEGRVSSLEGADAEARD